MTSNNHGKRIQNGNFKNLFEQNYLWDIILKHAKWRTQTSPTHNPGIIYLLEEISEVMINFKKLLEEFYQIDQGLISGENQAFKVPKLVKKLIGLNDQEKLRLKDDTKLPHNLIFLQNSFENTHLPSKFAPQILPLNLETGPSYSPPQEFSTDFEFHEKKIDIAPCLPRAPASFAPVKVKKEKVENIEVQPDISSSSTSTTPTMKPMWNKNQDGSFSCTYEGCTSTMTWPSSIDVYLHFSKEHQSMEQRRNPTEFFKCDIGGCNLKFPTRHELNKHRNHKHEEMFKFQCDICAKRLATNKLLKVHLIQHSGEKPFHCKHCDYKAITTSLVKQHTMRMHEELQDTVLPRHICDLCGKSFKVRSNLKEHMGTHSDARPFLCGVCGRALKNQQCLNRHLFTHGVKHTCGVCGKNFASTRSLGIHTREKHGIFN